MATLECSDKQTPKSGNKESGIESASGSGATTPTTRANEPVLDEKRLKKFYVGAIDAGTTSSRFIIFDGTGTPVTQHQIEFAQKYPNPGCASPSLRPRSPQANPPLTGGMNKTLRSTSRRSRNASKKLPESLRKKAMRSLRSRPSE